MIDNPTGKRVRVVRDLLYSLRYANQALILLWAQAHKAWSVV